MKNQYIHIDFQADAPKTDTEAQSASCAVQSANKDLSKSNSCTLEEQAILAEIKKDPCITQKKLAEILGKSERTIKTRTVEMQNKGIIKRENGKRNGRWQILRDV